MHHPDDLDAAWAKGHSETQTSDDDVNAMRIDLSSTIVDAFEPYFRIGVVAAIVGTLACAGSMLPLNDMRFVLRAVAYVAVLYVVVIGYTYASFVWRIPKLNWLGGVATVTALVIWVAVMFPNAEHRLDDMGLMLSVGSWVIRSLVILSVVCATFGWISYFRHQSTV